MVFPYVHSLFLPNSADHQFNSSITPLPVNILLAQFDKIVFLKFSLEDVDTSNCAKFCADITVATLYFLYIVNIASVALQMKSGNSSIYKKFGTLVFSVPGLLNTAFCIDIKKNRPNAL